MPTPREVLEAVLSQVLRGSITVPRDPDRMQRFFHWHARSNEYRALLEQFSFDDRGRCDRLAGALNDLRLTVLIEPQPGRLGIPSLERARMEERACDALGADWPLACRLADRFRQEVLLREVQEELARHRRN